MCVEDKQDVLAMCALQFASQIEQTQIDTSTETVDAFERLKRLDEKIEGLLSK